MGFLLKGVRSNFQPRIFRLASGEVRVVPLRLRPLGPRATLTRFACLGSPVWSPSALGPRPDPDINLPFLWSEPPSRVTRAAPVCLSASLPVCLSACLPVCPPLRHGLWPAGGLAVGCLALRGPGADRGRMSKAGPSLSPNGLKVFFQFREILVFLFGLWPDTRHYGSPCGVRGAVTLRLRGRRSRANLGFFQTWREKKSFVWFYERQNCCLSYLFESGSKLALTSIRFEFERRSNSTGVE